MNEPLPPADHATRAASFGAKAADYAEHWPDYPESAITWAVSGGLPETSRVLDLGAGTGKLTEGLLALGYEVVAVEPDPAMLAELSRRFPAAAALAGHAEDIPLDAASVDAVLIGQAFHWFDFDPAMTEIARVLRPGGVVAPLWNHDDESVGWATEFTRKHRLAVSRDLLKRGDGKLPDHPAFTPFEDETFQHSQRRTADSLIATIATHSHMLVATPEKREQALLEARDFLAATPETASGEFDLPLVTRAFRARLRG